MKELNQQIRFVYIYTFFSGMMFFYGVEQLFMNTIGDGAFVRGVTLAAFSISMFLSNIPTGAVSDIYGRVKSLKIGLVLLIASLVILGFSEGVIVYAIGSALFGLYFAFDEGAKEAFVYDILKDNKQEKRYQKILGRIYASLLIGAAAGNLLGGFIAEISSLRASYFVSILPCVVAFYCVMRLREPEHHKQAHKKVLSQLDDAWRAIKRSNTILIIVIAQLLIYTVGSISMEFMQLNMSEFITAPILFGGIWALLTLFMAFANSNAHRIKRVFAFSTLLLIMLILYVATRNIVISLIPLVVFVSGLEVLSIKGEGLLQNNTPSHLRATLSSIPGSLSMVAVAIIATGFGQITGSIAIPIFAASFSILLIVIILWSRIKPEIDLLD